MKSFPAILSVTMLAAIGLTGCSKKEEAAPPQVSRPAPPPPPPAAPPVTETKPAPAAPAAPTVAQPAVSQVTSAVVAKVGDKLPPEVTNITSAVTAAGGPAVVGGLRKFLQPGAPTAPPAPLAPAPTTAAAPVTLATLSHGEMTGGLKEALAHGIQHAITQLGKDGGFLNNLDVKIPMPQTLSQVDKALRAMGQGKMADEFIATINHAAEQAVPEAAQVFGDAIKAMTVADARAVLTGPNDSATQHFRKTGEEQLRQKFLPIVKTATEKAGVTAAYKNMIGKAGPAASFLGKEAGDLDGYVTQKSLDGLFKMIAVEEKRIRENPVARTTDILKKVFGAPPFTNSSTPN